MLFCGYYSGVILVPNSANFRYNSTNHRMKYTIKHVFQIRWEFRKMTKYITDLRMSLWFATYILPVHGCHVCMMKTSQISVTLHH